MSKVTIVLEDVDGQVLASLDHGGAFNPKSPAHGVAHLMMAAMEAMAEDELSVELPTQGMYCGPKLLGMEH
jgi:hypothetical protein